MVKPEDGRSPIMKSKRQTSHGAVRGGVGCNKLGVLVLYFAWGKTEVSDDLDDIVLYCMPRDIGKLAKSLCNSHMAAQGRRLKFS